METTEFRHSQRNCVETVKTAAGAGDLLASRTIIIGMKKRRIKFNSTIPVEFSKPLAYSAGVFRELQRLCHATTPYVIGCY